MGTYLLLSFLYGLYLNLAKNGTYPPDFVTHHVAKQSGGLISALGYSAEVIPHDKQPTMKLFVEGKYLARIIEGCNAISIIILFIAFVIAFAERFKKTLLFILFGILLIYGVNLVRIAILAVALYEYPQYKHVLHGAVFPGLIYGMVFLLWMLWIRNLRAKKTPGT